MPEGEDGPSMADVLKGLGSVTLKKVEVQRLVFELLRKSLFVSMQA